MASNARVLEAALQILLYFRIHDEVLQYQYARH